MIIERIYITQFGAVTEREIPFRAGLNIIEGENESGKTTIASFIRFLFYGFSDIRTMERYFAFSDTLSGWLDCTVRLSPDPASESRSFRIQRTYTLPCEENAPPIQSCKIFARNHGEIVSDTPLFEGQIPGEVFFGVSEEIFSATAFVGQVTANTSAKKNGSYTGGGPIKAAIDRILYAANEELDPQAAILRLTQKKEALFDPTTERGTIYEMERRRSSLAATLAEAEKQISTSTAATEGVNTQQAADEPSESDVPDEDRLSASILAAIAEYEENKREKEERTAQLQKIYERYQEYQQYNDMEVLGELRLKKAASEQKTLSLTKSIFRGSYVPDRDYVASLYLCADDMQSASSDEKNARDELERIEFSVRRDNIKEKQLRRIALDGGVDVLRSRLDKIYAKRSIMTVCGILLLLLTIFALSATIFFFVLRSSHTQTAIFVTAFLAALAGFFFVSRSRYEKNLGAMLKRYACSTEDELENFLEEYLLSEGKLHALEESKDTIGERISDASLRRSEAARQAALLLSKLQPPDVPKITAERLTPDIVRTAVNRVERTLAEIERLKQKTAHCEDSIVAFLTAHGVESETALEARFHELQAFFGGRAPGEIETDVLRRELDFNLKSCAAITERIAILRAKLPAEKKVSAVESADRAHAVIPAKTADIGPDPRILRKLLEEMDAQLRRERRMYAALNIAIETMRSASTRLHNEIAPRLTATAGKLMRVLSDKRYHDLSIDDAMQLSGVAFDEAEEAEMPIDYMSAGTQDLAYLSLRIALLHMLYRKEMPPLLFDEAFATLDDKRLARMVALLLRTTSENGSITSASDHTTADPEIASQALIFTCHKRERRVAEAVHSCHVITL